MTLEPLVPFLDAIPPEWGPDERFPVLFHLLRSGTARPLTTGLCESRAYRSRMFAVLSAPKPTSRCFPR